MQSHFLLENIMENLIGYFEKYINEMISMILRSAHNFILYEKYNKYNFQNIRSQ